MILGYEGAGRLLDALTNALLEERVEEVKINIRD